MTAYGKDFHNFKFCGKKQLFHFKFTAWKLHWPSYEKQWLILNIIPDCLNFIWFYFSLSFLLVIPFRLLNQHNTAEVRLKRCTNHLLLSNTVKKVHIKWTRKESLKYATKFNHFHEIWSIIASTIQQSRTDTEKGIVRIKLLKMLYSNLSVYNIAAVHTFSFLGNTFYFTNCF